MEFSKITISCDPEHYAAWPDLVMTAQEKLICVFTECSHHCYRHYTRIMLTESVDHGRHWSPKRPLTETTGENSSFYYNCARICRYPGNRLAVIVDRIPRTGENNAAEAENVLYLSDDGGSSWSGPVILPVRGIVPDKVRMLDTGRLLLAAHHNHNGKLAQFLRYSDDDGASWSNERLIAFDPRYNLCEASLLPLGGGVVAAFVRENSGLGLDCFKSLSFDNGESWGSLVAFPLPGCHRPVAGLLQDGRVFITYRFCQGGGCGMGSGSQNFFAAFSDVASVLSVQRNAAAVRVIPIDYDRAPKADTGYSGWAQFSDGKIFVVNYIVDDALDKGQIRGYLLDPEEMMLLPGRRERCNHCNCSRICPRKFTSQTGI